MTFSYIIWDVSPEIISFGSFALRWYGLLFALGFLVTQHILYYIYKKENKPQQDVDTLTVYMIISTVLGARLGHVLFYEPEKLWTDPIGVISPVEFSPFRFTGYMGLASHGAAIGILIGLWIYANYSIVFSKPIAIAENGDASTIEKKNKYGVFITRRTKPGQSYLEVLDRIVILVVVAGCLIRLGNFFNSEIIGKPSNAPQSVVFVNQATDAIRKDPEYSGKVETMEVRKNEKLPDGAHGREPILLYFFFKPGVSEQESRGFLINNVRIYLARSTEFIDQPAELPLTYTLNKEPSGTYAAEVQTFGIARHPAQLYESASCLLLFFGLFWLWTLQKAATPPGRIFGVFLIVLWTLRFVYEFLKKNQVDFEDQMTLNMGQLLSIPFVLVGIYVLVRSYRTTAITGPKE
jgi:phosphatidylglycerol:prolipoprotein diacylglycerol transferase